MIKPAASAYRQLIRQLWFGMVICLLVIGGLLLRSLFLENTRSQQDTEKLITKAGELNAALLERTLNDHSRLLNTLSALIKTDTPQPILNQLMRNELATQPELMDLLILNKDGEIVSWTQDTPPPDVRDRPYYTEHRDNSTDQLVLSPPLASKVHANQYFFSLSRPTFDADNNFSGVVVAILSIDRLAETFKAEERDATTTIVVYDMAGRILFRLPRVPGDSGTVIPEIKNIPAGTTQTSTINQSPFDGKERWSSLKRLEAYPLWMAEAIETKPLKVARYKRAMVALGIFVLFTAPLFFLAIKVLRQLQLQIKAEAALQQSQEILIKQTEEMARSNAELEQFAYVASHDLRQPLRMVKSYVQLLERRLADKLDDDTRQMMHFATDGVSRMDQMLISLLEYSRVGRKGEQLAPLSSREGLDEALRFLAPAIQEAHASINITGNWPEIFAHRNEFTRLMQNLIGNAVKYRRDEHTPVIDISVVPDEAGWRFCVADNGIGIDPTQQDRLFRVFQRLHTRDKYEGTGIGLAVARKIVEHHGGRIWVESDGEDQGCRFCFTLPANNPEETAHT
jgi:signal transduction histidine kinase